MRPGAPAVMRRRGTARGGNNAGLVGRAGRAGGAVLPRSDRQPACHSATNWRVAVALSCGLAVDRAATTAAVNVAGLALGMGQSALTQSSTSAACPSTLTLGHTAATRPCSSTTKVARWMPI